MDPVRYFCRRCGLGDRCSKAPLEQKGKEEIKNMYVYNSLTRKKEEFKPLHEGKAGIYACGPTVYDYFHIGNARPFITFDILRRQLEREGYEVTFVQNFTDIDDKMIRRANEEGITVKELADRFIAEYYKDAKALGIRPATIHPKATEHIPDCIQRILGKAIRSVPTPMRKTGREPSAYIIFYMTPAPSLTTRPLNGFS